MKKPGVLCGMFVEKYENYRDLYVYRMKNHSIYDSSSLQNEHWEHDKEAPCSDLERDQGDNMCEVYNVHRSSILAPGHVSDIVSIYNLPCLNNINSSIIVDFVKEIYDHSHRTFKILFAAGLILQHIVTDEFHYWRPYRNQEFF